MTKQKKNLLKKLVVTTKFSIYALYKKRGGVAEQKRTLPQHNHSHTLISFHIHYYYQS